MTRNESEQLSKSEAYVETACIPRYKVTVLRKPGSHAHHLSALVGIQIGGVCLLAFITVALILCMHMCVYDVYTTMENPIDCQVCTYL